MTPPDPISASSGCAKTTMADSGTAVTISSLRSTWSGMRVVSLLVVTTLVVKGGKHRGQRGQDLLEALAHAGDVRLGLLRDPAARDVRDELVAARGHAQWCVDLELQGVDAAAPRLRTRGHRS